MLHLVLLLWTAFSSLAGHASTDQTREDLISIARGESQLMGVDTGVRRVAVGNPEVADVTVISPREVMIRGVTVGSTTLFVWDESDSPRRYAVEVNVDVAPIRRQFAELFPGEALEVSSRGNIIVLSGTVSGAAVARRMVEIASAPGATVIRNFYCIRPSVDC